MNIATLIRRVIDDANIRVQTLNSCVVGALTRRTGVHEIKFLTENLSPGELAAGEGRYMGLVVWIPAALYAATTTSPHQDEALPTIPDTWEDFEQAAADEPLFHVAASLVERGDLTREQALIRVAFASAASMCKLRQELIAQRSLQPRILLPGGGLS